MSKRHFFLGFFLSSILGATLASFIILQTIDISGPKSYESIEQRQKQVSFSSLTDTSYTIPKGLNFVTAANEVIPGVVHIRALYSSGQHSINPLEGFFRNQAQSSGSGVVISDDGYIVTNNHVIEDASQIEVVLNDNRSYGAKIVGTDPTTDLALLKIDEKTLNFVKYGNSDQVKPGEWVLAIGNPFDLNSTVTAGIVSAKARNIGILRDRNNLQIESFIQTDAAVNPGNSGGALVNLKGELIGINTAIATPTGSYAGYSFAVPVTLVKKVMDDLLEYGNVQRGLLGIRIGDVNARIAEAQGLPAVSGVIVSAVNENSGAQEAGLETGDVIIAINGATTNNVSELQEMVARNRPGDEIEVTYYREGEKKIVEATLRNTEGNINLITRNFSNYIEGVMFETLSADELAELSLKNGVRFKTVSEGKWKDAGIKSGFIVTSIDKIKVSKIGDLHQILQNKNGGILVEGVREDGSEGVYGVDW